jgi:hypothetical protein
MGRGRLGVAGAPRRLAIRTIACLGETSVRGSRGQPACQLIKQRRITIQFSRP